MVRISNHREEHLTSPPGPVSAVPVDAFGDLAQFADMNFPAGSMEPKIDAAEILAGTTITKIPDRVEGNALADENRSI